MYGQRRKIRLSLSMQELAAMSKGEIHQAPTPTDYDVTGGSDLLVVHDDFDDLIVAAGSLALNEAA